MRTLAFVVAMLLASVANAAPKMSGNAYTGGAGTLINDIALNAAAASRTFTLTENYLLGYGVVSVLVKYTYSAATDVQMDCSTSDDFGTTYFDIQSCDVSAGSCTSSDANWTKDVSASANWTWRVDTLGFPRLKCVFSGTSAGASDKVTVTAFSASQ